jgi:hypothetical protein
MVIRVRSILAGTIFALTMVVPALASATTGAIEGVTVEPSLAHASTKAGQIGGKPTYPLGPPDEGKQTTAARVIGVGSSYDGWLQIDAYGWRPPVDSPGERHQFCTWIEFEKARFRDFGSCLGAGEIERPIAIESSAEIVNPKPLRATLIGGALTPNVTRVVLSVRRRNGKLAHPVEATVARVSGGLQHQLRQYKPFGYFFAKVPLLVHATRDARAIAYDADGKVVGSAQGLSPQGT